MARVTTRAITITFRGQTVVTTNRRRRNSTTRNQAHGNGNPSQFQSNHRSARYRSSSRLSTHNHKSARVRRSTAGVPWPRPGEAGQAANLVEAVVSRTVVNRVEADSHMVASPKAAVDMKAAAMITDIELD